MGHVPAFVIGICGSSQTSTNYLSNLSLWNTGTCIFQREWTSPPNLLLITNDLRSYQAGEKESFSIILGELHILQTLWIHYHSSKMSTTLGS